MILYAYSVLLSLLAANPNYAPNTDSAKPPKGSSQKQFDMHGIIWSKNQINVRMQKKNKVEYILSKSDQLTKFVAIGPFVKSNNSILSLEYNLDIMHDRPFIINFESWTRIDIESKGTLYDAGLIPNKSKFWILEGIDINNKIETNLLLYSEKGQALIRQKITTPGKNIIKFNNEEFEIHVRLARGIDLIN